jgi:hypothetical protein
MCLFSLRTLSLVTMCSHIHISKSQTAPCFLMYQVGHTCTSHRKFHMPYCTNWASNEYCTSICTIEGQKNPLLLVAESGWRYQTKLCVVKFLKQEYFVNGVCSTLRLMLVHYSKANYRQYPQHKKQA